MTSARLEYLRHLFILLAASSLAASAHTADVSGGKDHPLISRFNGATLTAYKAVDFDEATVIAKPLPDEDKPAQGTLVKLEGKVTHNGYVIQGGKTALEVMRNYEQAFAKAGFQTVFQCNDQASCGGDLGGYIINGGTMAPSLFPASFAPRDRYLLARRETPQGTVHALALVMQDDSNRLVNVYQQVIEAKPMATGQVQVLTADAMNRGLAAEGRVAVYGVHFDNAKAEIKAESAPSLNEMAKLLTGQPSLKVYIVGHTDNTGALATNLDLSQRRAEAVVKALVGMKIEPSRLLAKGVASLAPVASNANDASKAKNRRVELVMQ